MMLSLGQDSIAVSQGMDGAIGVLFLEVYKPRKPSV